ncbi:MAG: alkaline phosphatase D family protein [Rhodospirillales bacterium]
MSRLILPPIDRRRFMLGAAATGLALPFINTSALAQRFSANPFSLGVASGCPTADGVILWTRLADQVLRDAGRGLESVDVNWELAADDRFAKIVQRGSVRTRAVEAHSARVELRGLKPHRWYWYRFMVGDAVSAVGRTRTAAAAGDAAPLRLAFASCAQYEQGYFSAYRHMASEDLDLGIHLGDYIYEISWGARQVRRHGSGVPTTLPEFRDRYALYKSDPDLQAAHAAFPWLVTWDDHEVADDYANDRSRHQIDSAFFLRMRAAAYRAYWEHMPLPRAMMPNGPDMTIYGGWRFGATADVLVLDDRQYRSHQTCGTVDGVADCAERLAPERTMLGTAQEKWLADRLAQRNGKWTIVAQQTLMAQANRARNEKPAYWMDGWDGYPAARQRLIDAIAEKQPSNPVVIGGDVHSFWMADLKRDFNKPDSAVVASELVGSSITSQGPNPDHLKQMLAKNPHLKYARAERRGYATLKLDGKTAQATFRAVGDVTDEDTGIEDLARFAIENGKAGAQKA